MFEASDADKSGGISKAEFENIMVILCAQILSRIMVYVCVLLLFVPWFSKLVIDMTDSINEGSLIESVAEQVISMSIFMGVVPFLWNAIDSRTESTIDMVNASSTLSNESKKD